MRKLRLITLFFFLIISQFVAGQVPAIKNDRTFSHKSQKFLDSIGFLKNYEDRDLEFRIWFFNLSSGQNKVVRLTQSNGEKWHCRTLEYYCYNDDHCRLDEFSIKDSELSSNWTEIWKSIVEEDLLNVQNQKEVNFKLNRKLKEFLVVADGLMFTFEITTKKASHKFSYENSDSHFKFYQENGVFSKHYLKVTKLIDLLNKEFSFAK